MSVFTCHGLNKEPKPPGVIMLPQTPNIDFQNKVIIIIQETQKPKEQLYTIKENDTLTKIAQDTHTTIEKLWEKNTDLQNPNMLEPNKQLKIPTETEELPDRPLPIQKPPEQPQNVPQATVRATPAQPPTKRTTYDPSNLYAPGYCTYYAKQQRPDMPNNLGNADTWYANAAAQGFAVGYTPRVGAVAAAIGYMHVAIVTAVHGDTIEVSEMNYGGLWVVSTRTAPVSEFRYIY